MLLLGASHLCVFVEKVDEMAHLIVLGVEVGLHRLHLIDEMG